MSWDEDNKRAEQKRAATVELSGQCLVLGELLRREWPAFISYGEGKEFDVIIKTKAGLFSPCIKTTRDSEWSINTENRNYLIFVRLPRNYGDSPEYFILRPSELLNALKTRIDLETERRKSKKTSSLFGSFVWQPPTVLLEEVAPFRNSWDSLALDFHLARRDWNEPTRD